MGFNLHMLKFLQSAKQTLEKELGALKEDFPLGDYIQAPIPSVEPSPFPHIVVDNLFNEKTYEGLLKHFQSVLDRGFSEQDDPTRFHPFLDLHGDYAYDGYVYVPRPEEDKALTLLFSVAWNMLFSKLFGQPTSWCTTVAYHHHPPGDRTGFVHHDYATKIFSLNNRLPNGVIFHERDKAPAISQNNVPLLKERRGIALLYYLGDNAWEQGDGGETGLYLSKGESPVKLIAPKNNRLLAFHISLKSFHALQETFKPRSSIVQWFHVPAWREEK